MNQTYSFEIRLANLIQNFRVTTKLAIRTGLLSLLLAAVSTALAERMQPFVGWIVDMPHELEGRLIHPQCFTTEWWSSDNFEEYEDTFSITDTHFRTSPGKFFGREIVQYSPIKASWSHRDNPQYVSLIKGIKSCSPFSGFDHVLKEQEIYISKVDGTTVQEMSYEIIADLSMSSCDRLAPNIGSSCKKAFVVKVGEYSGGSIGWRFVYGAYGLFDLPELGSSIVPLKYYSNHSVEEGVWD